MQVCTGFIRGVGIQAKHHLSILPSFLRSRSQTTDTQPTEFKGESGPFDGFDWLVDSVFTCSGCIAVVNPCPRCLSESDRFWCLPLRSGWLCTQAGRVVSSIFARFSCQWIVILECCSSGKECCWGFFFFWFVFCFLIRQAPGTLAHLKGEKHPVDLSPFACFYCVRWFSYSLRCWFLLDVHRRFRRWRGFGE